MRVSSFSILKRMVFLPLMNFFSGIDADVEVVVEQVVVGAIAAVFAAQDVGARRRAGVAWSGRGRGRSGRRRTSAGRVVGGVLLAHRPLVEPTDDVL